MKVVHCCLSCFYIDNFTYQENMLVREHVKLGHDVLVLASTETFGTNNELSYIEPSEYMGSDGAKVIRLPYMNFLPHAIMKKLRMYLNVYKILDSFNPDIIMFHGLCAWELTTIAKYTRNNRNVKLYVDSHEDFHNSAKGLISYYFLHKLYYNLIIKYSKKYIQNFLYITLETKLFCKKMYNLSDDELEFYPLGGHVLNDDDYFRLREETRKSLHISLNSIVFLQTGKFDHLKKLIETIKSFSLTNRSDFKYIIAGFVPEELLPELTRLMKLDPRIEYKGWINSYQLQGLLCATDVYVQPGPHQSATMQMSLCARCAVILHDFPSHSYIFNNNGWLIKEQNEVDNVFLSIENNSGQLEEMSKKSYDFAKEWLDYSKLAKRILD